MKNKKTLTILLIVMIMVVISVPVIVLADDTKTATGEITISSVTAPEISGFSITSGTPAGLSGTTLSPTGELDVEVTVTDADGASNIEDVMFVIWYTSDGAVPTTIPSETFAFKSDADDSNILHWVHVSDSLGTYMLDTTNTGWGEDATNSPHTKTDVANGYTFTFNVIIGGEALSAEPSTSNDRWNMAVFVRDADDLTDFICYDTGNDYGMEWYGEMHIDTDSGPRWDMATANMAYTAKPAFVGGYDMNIISNGDYDLQVSADEVWEDSMDAGTFIYCTPDAASDNQFSLAVDIDDDIADFQIITDATVEGSGVTDIVTIPRPTDSSWGEYTDFDGVTITNIYMFLKTNAVMPLSTGVFEGTIYFTVTNYIP